MDTNLFARNLLATAANLEGQGINQNRRIKASSRGKSIFVPWILQLRSLSSVTTLVFFGLSYAATISSAFIVHSAVLVFTFFAVRVAESLLQDPLLIWTVLCAPTQIEMPTKTGVFLAGLIAQCGSGRIVH